MTIGNQVSDDVLRLMDEIVHAGIFSELSLSVSQVLYLEGLIRPNEAEKKVLQRQRSGSALLDGLVREVYARRRATRLSLDVFGGTRCQRSAIRDALRLLGLETTSSAQVGTTMAVPA